MQKIEILGYQESLETEDTIGAKRGQDAHRKSDVSEDQTESQLILA